jgi:RNA polymerase sigma-70 factor (ECF subfamily)
MADEEALTAAIEEGRRAWPALEVPADQFEVFLAERIDEGHGLSELVVADLYLACACQLRVSGAIAAFESYCKTAVDGAIARIGGAGAVADEARQIVRDLLFVGKDGSGAISSYSGRGSLRGWVRIVTVREALRLVRKASKDVAVDDEVMFDALAPTARDDPKLEYLKTRYREQFRSSFRQAVADLPRRERTALKMSVLDGLSIDEIGTTFRVHRSTAARWLTRAREVLLDATRAHMMKELDITETDVDSVIRLIQSNLHLTLDSAFKSRK